jgi:hypothetical protein
MQRVHSFLCLGYSVLVLGVSAQSQSYQLWATRGGCKEVGDRCLQRTGRS